jgi:hypothetical protein
MMIRGVAVASVLVRRLGGLSGKWGHEPGHVEGETRGGVRTGGSGRFGAMYVR